MSYIKYSEMGGVLLMGDFNARTGVEDDIDESNKFTPGPDQVLDDPVWKSLCTRNNRDSTVNQFSKKSIVL
jgi:hypothetical protein